jgi:hypothetical protein
MRLSRRRRIALLLPWALLSRVELTLQYASVSGGGRLGAAAAVLGLCVGGTGAICVVGNGGPDKPPVIAHSATATPAPRRHVKKPRPMPTSTPAATVVARVSLTTPAAPRKVVTKHRKPVAKRSQKKDEFGFEGSAASSGRTSSPGVTATTASVKPSSGGGGGGPAAKSSPGEFGFEGG